MSRRLLAGLVIAMIPLVRITAAPPASYGTACANLAALTIPNITIKSASPVAARRMAEESSSIVPPLTT